MIAPAPDLPHSLHLCVCVCVCVCQCVIVWRVDQLVGDPEVALQQLTATRDAEALHHSLDGGGDGGGGGGGGGGDGGGKVLVVA